VIVAEHGGQVPRDLGELRALPGVGEYTGRAVQTFAYGLDAAPVDVNVARVLTRAIAGRPLGGRALQALADEAMPGGRAAEWASALMDLGARTCTARAPRCEACPVASLCAWRATQGEDPAGASAVRSRPQAAFAGSDRYHRGRLVDSLRRGPVAVERLPAAADLADPARLAAITDRLIDDGLVEWAEGALRLPR
jgi:A/G-specific adenine glycosylase